MAVRQLCHCKGWLSLYVDLLQRQGWQSVLNIADVDQLTLIGEPRWPKMMIILRSNVSTREI